MENKTMKNQEWFEKCVNESDSIINAIIKLGYNTPSNFYRMFHKYQKLYNIDISHFDKFPQKRNNKYETKDILINNFQGSVNGNNIKSRLYKEGLKTPCCELCGQDENWITGKISLILDHISGNNKDNRIENLRIICPNCDAALPTFKAKNINKENKIKKEHNHNDDLFIIEKYKEIIKNYKNEGFGWKIKVRNKLGWGLEKLNNFIKKHCDDLNTNIYIEEKIKLVEENYEYISFNKSGWSSRLGIIFNKPSQHAYKFIQINKPEIFEICFKHKK
jgi:5-methylcytosine-specific restriction endonuclease McrA